LRRRWPILPLQRILRQVIVSASFSNHRYSYGMTGNAQLRPATVEDVAQAIAFACSDGRRRVHSAESMMARITAAAAPGTFGAIGIRGDAEAAGTPIEGARVKRQMTCGVTGRSSQE
jgi:hypothetical protein